MISDSILESDEDETEEENENKRGKPLAKLCILKNDHIPESGEWFAATTAVWKIMKRSCFLDPPPLSLLSQNCPSFWVKTCWDVTPTLAPCPYHHPQYQSSTPPLVFLSTGEEVAPVRQTWRLWFGT